MVAATKMPQRCVEQCSRSHRFAVIHIGSPRLLNITGDRRLLLPGLPCSTASVVLASKTAAGVKAPQTAQPEPGRKSRRQRQMREERAAAASGKPHTEIVAKLLVICVRFGSRFVHLRLFRRFLAFVAIVAMNVAKTSSSWSVTRQLLVGATSSSFWSSSVFRWRLAFWRLQYEFR